MHSAMDEMKIGTMTQAQPNPEQRARQPRAQPTAPAENKATAFARHADLDHRRGGSRRGRCLGSIFRGTPSAAQHRGAQRTH